MTKQEVETIRNIIARLREPNLGCSHMPHKLAAIEAMNTYVYEGERRAVGDGQRIEAASRIYLETWIIGALECLLPGEGRNPALAVSMSRK